MHETRRTCRILVETLKGRDYLKDQGVDGRIILNVSQGKGIQICEPGWTGYIKCSELLG
jgi:hypothetical protein